ncbi:MAG: PGDYG domain-containing protein [Deltaproteobacteria bacterium]|jgi:hypothetical protein|nr:PGDYG domain-containing protein [Deltaproteobacteria bacterium]
MMREFLRPSVANLLGSVLAEKKAHPPARADFATEAGVLSTLEGQVPYAAGDAILTGPSGERWPVDREAFLGDYQPLPPTLAGEAGLYAKKPIPVWAKRMEGPFRVLSDALSLTGRKGDWLVQYGPGRYGVVAARVFEATYRLLED